MKKLYRSLNNRVLAGVCGGLGEYFNVDPTIVRLIWVVFCCMGAGILAYIIAALVIPNTPSGYPNPYDYPPYQNNGGYRDPNDPNQR